MSDANPRHSDRRPPADEPRPRRAQGHHPAGRRRGVHRDGPAGRARVTWPGRPGVNVSSATVRNDMVDARAGGLPPPAPHQRRAGARPTRATGSSSTRSTGPAVLGAGDAQQVRSFFAEAHGELEQMLADTSRLLSSLTQYAAVVVGPPPEAATVRSVQLVGLAPRGRAARGRAVERRDRQAHPRARRRRRRRRAGGGRRPAGRRPRRASPWRRRPTRRAGPARRRDRRRRRSTTWPCVVQAARAALGGSATRRRPGLHRRHVADGLGVRRRRDRQRGAADPRAAVRRGHAAARRARPGPARGHRHRDRHGAAGRLLGRRVALRGRGRAGRHASACSARPA